MCSESNLEEPGLWHVARPPRHLRFLLRGEDMGGTGGAVSAPDRVEGQLGWSQIHRTAGQQSKPIQFAWLMHVTWDLTGIRFSQIRSRNPNEIIFGLNDGYYAADFDQKVQPSVCFVTVSYMNCIVRSVCLLFCFLNIYLWLSQDQSELKKNSLLQVDQSSVRNSYSVFSLLR